MRTGPSRPWVTRTLLRARSSAAAGARPRGAATASVVHITEPPHLSPGTEPHGRPERQSQPHDTHDDTAAGGVVPPSGRKKVPADGEDGKSLRPAAGFGLTPGPIRE